MGKATGQAGTKKGRTRGLTSLNKNSEGLFQTLLHDASKAEGVRAIGLI